MSTQLNGHQTAMGSTQRDRKLLTVVALTAVLVAVLSIAGLKTAVSSPSAAPALASSPLAPEPAAAPAPPAAPAPAPAAPAPAPAAPAPVAPAKTVVAPSKAATKSVMIMGYTYSPASLTVNVGDTVTWTNMDTAPHTVTVTDGPVKFDSGTMQKGDTYSYTFKEAGTYQYYCAVHPDMKASITVVGDGPAPSEEPTPTEEPTPSGGPTPEPDACEGLSAAVDTFMVHFNAAHLETSLGQQILEALSLDQYALTHTILIKNMLAPLLGGLTGAADTFMQHVYAAHLETSPGQQVADAIQIDKYALAHTSMIGNMLRPLLGSDLSSC
jgi:plastocyanin